jgi:AcrR family transcriptional regulator
MPKIVDHEIYREELLTQCMPLFVAKGVSAVSVRELSSVLGVSTGTLYYYFPTKEALFESMVRLFVEKDSREIAELSKNGTNVFDLIDYISTKEAHFINLVLLAVDVKRSHADSKDLIHLLDDSWNAYAAVLGQFFPNNNGKAGEAFLSFFVGALFLKSTRSDEIKWRDLFDGLETLTSFLNR